jgi:hypothetical protein
LHVFILEILVNMTQMSDVAPGPLVFFFFISLNSIYSINSKQYIHNKITKEIKKQAILWLM